MKIPKCHDPSGILWVIWICVAMTAAIVVYAGWILSQPEEVFTETVVPARLLPIPDPVASPPHSVNPGELNHAP